MDCLVSDLRHTDGRDGRELNTVAYIGGWCSNGREIAAGSILGIRMGLHIFIQTLWAWIGGTGRRIAAGEPMKYVYTRWIF